MQTWSDARLLRAYADNGAEDAFAKLIERHADLVYSAALRQVNSPDLAGEIAQRVYVALALDARSLAARLSLEASVAGWLNDCLIDVAGDYASYNLTIGADGMAGTIMNEQALHGAIQSYLAANNNQPLTDPAQLQPYVTTPEEKTALQHAIQAFKPQ